MAKGKVRHQIGNNVWIGADGAIVVNVEIGNNVFIVPSSYANCDIPSHSIVSAILSL